MSDEYAVHDRIGRGRTDLIRVGIVVAAGLTLVVSAAVTLGASPAPTAAPGVQAPGANGEVGGQPGSGPIRGFGSWLPGPGALGGNLPAFGGGDGPGGAFGGIGKLGGIGGFGRTITITKVDGNAISLKTDDGWMRTITVTDATQITKGSQKATVSDLTVGDQILFGQTKASDGSYSITRIVIVVPQVGGTVTSVDSVGFSIKQRDGTTKAVTVGSSTTYTIGSKAGSKADVAVGSRVDVEGSPAGAAFAASVVHIQPSVLGGTVTATSTDSITVKKRDGTTGTIHVDGSTTYRIMGAATGKLSDVTVGMIVQAVGTLRSDGSIDADSVFGGSFRMPGLEPPNTKPDTTSPSR